MASIEEAKNIIKDTPISGVINFYHSISKKGQNYVGICPFHADTKPSMSVNDQKGLYKCFACGAGGDAIKFVQDLQNLNFIESVKDIAGKLGLVIEEQHKKKENPKIDMGLRVLSVANKIYKKISNEVSPSTYLNFLKHRNLNESSVENFSIGYAPGNNALIKYLESIKDSKDRDFALNVAKEMGIVREGKDNRGDYDFFRDRVVFPIWDHFGKVRGFSSRAVLENQKPKYLNSGESFIFDKGNILYGHHIAKSHIREKNQAILVEGNMDTVVMHQFGFNNTVGTMGTAFSENNAKILGNITKNIYLAMDNDDAGFQGMIRANEHFMKIGILPKILNFSPEKDPDDFLNRQGRLELLERLENAPSFLDFYIEKIIPSSIPESVDQKLEILHQVFDAIKTMEDNLIAIEKVIWVGQKLGLKSTNDDISKAYRDFISKFKDNSQRFSKKIALKTNIVTESSKKMNDLSLIAKRASKKKEALTKAQEHVVKELIIHPECLEYEEIAEILDFIGNNEVKRLIKWLKDMYLEIDDSDYVNVLKTKLEDDISESLKSSLTEGLFKYAPTKLNEKVITKLLIDLKLNLQKEEFKIKRAELVVKQKNAKDKEESEDILKQITEHDKDFIAFSKKK